jgi:ABC-type Fe3+-hydroxamate transport system substrate-binding protein
LIKFEVYDMSGKGHLFFLLILAGLLAGASATLEVPGDLDDDNVISVQEMDLAEQDHQKGNIDLDSLEEVRHIFESYPRTVSDSAGTEVTIYKPLERVVVLNKAAVEVMRSLDAEDLIVAVDQNTAGELDFFPEISILPNVGSLSSPDTEAVLEQHPDAVIHYATVMTSGAEHLQAELGSVDPTIAMIRLDLSKPESYVQEVGVLGRLLEREEEARGYLDFYNDSTTGISEKVDDLDEDEKPRVYLEIWSEMANGSIDLLAYEEISTFDRLEKLGADREDYEAVYVLGVYDLYYAFNVNVSSSLVQAFQDGLNDTRKVGDDGTSAYQKTLYRHLPVSYSENNVSEEQVVELVDLTAADLEEDAPGTLAKIDAGEHPYSDEENLALYVFVYDTKVILVADAGNPGLSGQNMSGKTDVSGKAFRDELIAGALANGTGWVDYIWTNPAAGGLFHKTTYYRLAIGSDGVEYVVCGGKYKEAA